MNWRKALFDLHFKPIFRLIPGTCILLLLYKSTVFIIEFKLCIVCSIQSSKNNFFCDIYIFFIILLKAVLNYSSKLLAISTTYYLYLWSEQESVCDKNNAPSVSSISRVLRGGHVSELCTSGDEGRTNHSIDGILGKPKNSARHFNCIWSVLAVRVWLESSM